MCERCTAIEQYSGALAAIFARTGKVLAEHPEIVDPPESAVTLAKLFDLLAICTAQTRDFDGLIDKVRSFSPEDKKVLYGLTDALGLISEGARVLLQEALLIEGVQIKGTSLAESFKKARGKAGVDLGPDGLPTDTHIATETVGAEIGFRAGGLTGGLLGSHPDGAAIEGILAEVAQKIADISGGAVTVGTMVEGKDGRLTKVGEQEVSPSEGKAKARTQFPMPFDRTKVH